MSVPEETVPTSDSLEFKPKMHYEGKVVMLSLAGAVVDIGVGKPAVLHISQIVSESDQAIKRVEDILKVDQTVDVWVKKVKDGRIELTMIKPLDLEWRDIKKDMTVKGIVVRLETFGAFLEIGAERPGLIHISEMSHSYVRTPADILKEGDEVEAVVIDVNRRKKQIKLSMKALQPEPVQEEFEEAEPLKSFDQPRRDSKDKDKAAAVRRKKTKVRGKDDLGNVDELMETMNENNAAEAEPTAMEIAIRNAMQKAKSRKQEAEKSRRAKGVSSEQENILARTLENKVQS